MASDSSLVMFLSRFQALNCFLYWRSLAMCQTRAYTHAREYQDIPRKELVLLCHDLGHLGQRHVLPPVQIGDGILVLGKVGVGGSGGRRFRAGLARRGSKGKSHDGWGSRDHLRPRPTPEVDDQREKDTRSDPQR